MVTAPFLVQPLFTQSQESCLLHREERARVPSHGPCVSEDGCLAACPGHGLCVSEDGLLAACLGVFMLSDTPQPELKMTSARAALPTEWELRVTHGGSVPGYRFPNYLGSTPSWLPLGCISVA